jgi:L-iditol 2-dehydrogenase
VLLSIQRDQPPAKAQHNGRVKRVTAAQPVLRCQISGLVREEDIEAVRQVSSTWDAGSHSVLAPGARVNLFAGLDPTETTVAVDARALHCQGISLFASVNSTPQQNAGALSLIAEGAIDVERVVSARLPLSRANEAMRLAITKESLKIVIEP